MPDPLSRAFAALSDPTRRSILIALSEGGLNVNDLVERHHLSQPAISKHIKVLEHAGLVRRAQVGRSRPVVAEPQALVAAADWIEKARAGWNEAFGRMDELLDALENKEMKDD